jgi:hypothetical protein
MWKRVAPLMILSLTANNFAYEKPARDSSKSPKRLDSEAKEILKEREILENLELLKDFEKIRYFDIFADKKKDQSKETPPATPTAKEDPGKKQ